MREFVPIAVSDAAKALPNIGGSGWVRDLQEAATASPELIDKLNAIKTTTGTRADYRNSVNDLMAAWGNDSLYNSAADQALAAGYGLILSEPQDAQESAWLDSAVKASAEDRGAFRNTLSAADQTKFAAMRERMVGKRGAANDVMWREAA